jgi:hypothetical protein
LILTVDVAPVIVQATKARLSEVEASLKSAQEEVSAVRAEREMAVMSLKAEAATQLAQARTEGAQQVSVLLLRDRQWWGCIDIQFLHNDTPAGSSGWHFGTFQISQQRQLTTPVAGLPSAA